MIQRGFTLLETIIYIALFSMLMTGVLVTVYELIDSGTHNRMAVAVQEEGVFINRKLSWALSGATSVSVSSDKKTLTITHPAGALYPVTMDIKEKDGQMLLIDGTTHVLTTSEFKVENTVIDVEPASAGLPTAIRVRYDIERTSFIFKTYLRY